MGSGYVNPEVLVDTEWVAQNSNSSTVKLVEVDVDTKSYDSGHIAGAVGWNWQTDLTTQPVRDLISTDQLNALLSSSGVNDGDTLVLYGDNNNWFAAWAFWQLTMAGYPDLRLMNGGRLKWAAEGRALTADVPSPEAGNATVPGGDHSLRATREDVLSGIGQAERGLVDVRSPGEFSGELLAPDNLPQEGAQRGGHVPGASNIPWLTAVNDDGTFKSADELREIYEGKGITADKDIVAYCRIGERSSHSWFALKYLLGYPNVRNYDGSWTEWGSMVGVPIER